jgi:hypothetical protein
MEERSGTTTIKGMKILEKGLRSATEVHRRREGLATRGEMTETPSPVCDELRVDAELRWNFEGR